MVNQLVDMLGQGPSIHNSLVLRTPGNVNIGTLAVPSGKAITVVLSGPGGGGGGSDSGSGLGASGGGGGAGCCVVVPADLWAAGGNLNIGVHGTGGNASADGGDGGTSILQLFGMSGSLTANGGHGGKTVATTPGAGGLMQLDPGDYTVITAKNGTPGSNGTAVSGGNGGVSPVGMGAGGKGGDTPSHAGVNGQDGYAVLTWE